MFTNLKLAQVVFHFGSFLYYAFVNVNLAMSMQRAHERLGIPRDYPKISRMVDGTVTYFTIWNLVIQQLYFFLCCTEYLLDIFPKALPAEVQEKLRSTRSMILSAFLFPCSCEVAFNFWTIYWYSPRLVFGDLMDIINPMWLNHAIHTFVVPIALLEVFLRSRSEGIWDGDYFRDVNKLNALFTAYIVTIIVGYQIRGTWPYPVMDLMNGMSFTILMILSFLTGWTWFFTGKYFSRIFSVRGSTTRSDPVCSHLKTKHISSWVIENGGVVKHRR